MRQELPPKYTTSVVMLSFDFLSNLSPGDTVASAVVDNVVFSGTDLTPTAMLSGSPVINPTSVDQLCTGGVSGVVYFPTCVATTALGQKLVKVGYLAVLDPTA